MTDEIDLWKQRIVERKAAGQTIDDWCREHNIKKGSYHYWRKQVKNAGGTAGKSTASLQPVTFVKVQTTDLAGTMLRINWQDVSFQITGNQEARLAAEVITHLRSLC